MPKSISYLHRNLNDVSISLLNIIKFVTFFKVTLFAGDDDDVDDDDLVVGDEDGTKCGRLTCVNDIDEFGGNKFPISEPFLFSVLLFIGML